MVQPVPHSVDDEQTGEEVYTREVEAYLSNAGVATPDLHAKKIVDLARGMSPSLVIIQQGQLTKVLDAAKEALEDKEQMEQKLEKCSDMLRDILSKTRMRARNKE